MINKAIVLAGGFGSRMSPLTKAVNKQLLPLHDKPLIFYPLSILMLAKIKNILIIVNKGQVSQFKKIIPDGKNLGINLSYIEQSYPRGLPDAFLVAKDFIKNDKVALILGDNFFYAQDLTEKLIKYKKLKFGAKIILHSVKNPSLYGIATVNSKNKIISLKEKQKKPKSKLAITGLYFFDNKVVNFSKTLKPSKRKELEMVDLLNKYRKKNLLKADFLGRGSAWMDTGSIKDFYNTSQFVSTIENRQGFKIACLEEIALGNKWIKKTNIKKAIKFYGNCDYSKYLTSL